MRTMSDIDLEKITQHKEGYAPFFGDSEIDFDDERDDEQYPLDFEEAQELGVLLDDPERMEPDDAS